MWRSMDRLSKRYLSEGETKVQRWRGNRGCHKRQVMTKQGWHISEGEVERECAHLGVPESQGK